MRPFGVHLGIIWGRFEVLLGLLWVSFGVLMGSSWGSWRHLGPSWAMLSIWLITFPTLDYFLRPFGVHVGASNFASLFVLKMEAFIGVWMPFQKPFGPLQMVKNGAPV